MYVHGIRALFAFEGYVVSKITMSGDLVQVNLRRDRRLRLACPSCGATMGANRTEQQTQSLMRLLHMNRNLAVVYILKDALRKLWDYKYPAAAAKYLDRWCRWAAVSGIEAVRRFGRSLTKARDQVLNYFRHPITTGPLEGFNNTVSRIVHRACGVRSLDYLFLKLRQESLEGDLQK